MNSLKLGLLKFYYNTILIADNQLTIIERFEHFIKSFLTLAPVAFILGAVGFWFENNKVFGSGIISLIFLNMIVGMYMHYKNKSFCWGVLLKKTLGMILIVMITYLVLEVIIKVAGNNFVTEGFKAVLQVATLLYPGSKILKNVFILSNGEHPPKWIMERIYNFQENGNLKEFLKTSKEGGEVEESGFIEEEAEIIE